MSASLIVFASEYVERARANLAKTKGNVEAASKLMHVKRATFFQHVVRMRAQGLLPPKDATTTADAHALKAGTKTKILLPKMTVEARPAKVRVVLMTAAQDETGTYEAALNNLQAYAAQRDGEVIVGGFTYQKGLFEEHMVDTGHFSQRIEKLLRPEVVDLAPKLTWFGKANILPTAVDPLTGWETNTRDHWAVFPHAKIALKSVPVMPGRPGKQIMTTGVITKPNYVQKNAGQKAEFHHTPGATIAEIRPDGVFFLRQISFGKDGSFQDLDVFVKDGEVMPGPPVEAITWGDVHYEELDMDVAKVLWGWTPVACGPSIGPGGSSMLDDLKPKHQFFHDSFSMKARGHHTIRDPHENALIRSEKQDSVRNMFVNTAHFLRATMRDWSTSVHVASNHNAMLDTWLKDTAGHYDPGNARIWHELNAAWFKAIEDGDGEEFQAHIFGLRNSGSDLEGVRFLNPGNSYLVCQDTAPIECGLHGDKGPRGTRGSPMGMAKLVERMNTAHTHEPQIRDGAYIAGTSSRLDLRYASKGPGAWHHAEIVTYQSGKRTIVTLADGRYRA